MGAAAPLFVLQSAREGAMETWYILVTRHFDSGDKKELHIGQCGALECNSEEHALELIANLKKQPYTLGQGESAAPNYEPIHASMLDSAFPNRKKI